MKNLKISNLPINGVRGLYTNTIDLYKYLNPDMDYEDFRMSLIDYACKSSIYSYYKMRETNPDKYEYRVNVDWYEYKIIKTIINKLWGI